MRGLALLRRLNPTAGLLLAAAVAVAAVAVGHGAGLRWDPFGIAGRRLHAAQARAVAAESDAVARRLEAEGLAGQARRLDEHHQQAVAVGRATAEAAAQARSAHDASIPLDSARADRLLRHDRELCRLAPAVCAPSTTGVATGGGATLHAGPPG